MAGILLYILVVQLLCRSLIKLVREGGIGRSDVRRLIYSAYFSCGRLAVTAAAFNPVSPRLIWVSGFSGSFLAFLGLLRIPGVVDEYTTEAHAGKAIPFSPMWTSSKREPQGNLDGFLLRLPSCPAKRTQKDETRDGEK